MTIYGDLATLAAGLGRPLTDPLVTDAMVLVGLPVERSESGEDGRELVSYWSDFGVVEFLFEQDRLIAVIVQLDAGVGHETYPYADTLLDGLGNRAARDDIRAHFGEPEWAKPDADRYTLGAHHVRFGYDDGRVSSISLLETVPSPGVTVTGEITTYLDALGMGPNDPRLEAVLDLPGPTTDTNEERQNDGNILFRLAARSSGTEFMFSRERLAAVFLGTQPRGAWGVYPRPDAIVDGLPGTATRAEARALLGDPVWSSATDDRYVVREDYLQLHYRDDRIEVIVAAIGER